LARPGRQLLQRQYARVDPERAFRRPLEAEARCSSPGLRCAGRCIVVSCLLCGACVRRNGGSARGVYRHYGLPRRAGRARPRFHRESHLLDARSARSRAAREHTGRGTTGARVPASTASLGLAKPVCLWRRRHWRKSRIRATDTTTASAHSRPAPASPTAARTVRAPDRCLSYPSAWARFNGRCTAASPSSVAYLSRYASRLPTVRGLRWVADPSNAIGQLAPALTCATRCRPPPAAAEKNPGLPWLPTQEDVRLAHA
jgi:hypothetical protein